MTACRSTRHQGTSASRVRPQCVRRLVAETQSYGADHLGPVAEDGFVAVAESHELETAVHVPGSISRRLARQRHRHDTSDADKPEPLIAVEALVIIRETEPQSHGHGHAET